MDEGHVPESLSNFKRLAVPCRWYLTFVRGVSSGADGGKVAPMW